MMVIEEKWNFSTEYMMKSSCVFFKSKCYLFRATQYICGSLEEFHETEEDEENQGLKPILNKYGS